METERTRGLEGVARARPQLLVGRRLKSALNILMSRETPRIIDLSRTKEGRHYRHLLGKAGRIMCLRASLRLQGDIGVGERSVGVAGAGDQSISATAH